MNLIRSSINFYFLLVFTALFNFVQVCAQNNAEDSVIRLTWPTVERDGLSSIASANLMDKMRRKWDQTTLLTQLHSKGIIVQQLLKGTLTAQSLLQMFKEEQAYKQKLFECVQQSGLTPPEARKICERKLLQELLIYFRAQKLLDDTAVLILKAHVDQNIQQLGYLQQKYLDLNSLFALQVRLAEQRSFEWAQQQFKKDSAIEQTVIGLINPTSYRKLVAPWGKVSARQEFFLKYNSILLMNALAKLLKDANNKMLADAALVYDFDRDGVIDERVELTAGERYDAAFRLLKREIDKLTKSDGLFAGQSLESLHLLTATAELGLISDGMLKQMYLMPELTWKKPDKIKIYLNALAIIGKAAIAASPAGIYLAVPIIFIESYFQTKAIKEQKNAPTLFQD